MTKWLSDNWKEIRHKLVTEAGFNLQTNTNGTIMAIDLCDKVASVVFAILLKYLDEPCFSHPKVSKQRDHQGNEFYIKQHEHRYLCPSCMAELGGEK